MTLVMLMTFAAVFLLAVATLTLPISARSRARQSLGRLSEYDVKTQAQIGDLGFYERTMLPVLDSLAKFVKRRVSAQRLEGLRKKLAQAGVRRMLPEQFMALKIAISGGTLLAYFLFYASWLALQGQPPARGLVLVITNFFLPDVWLRRRISKRKKLISRALPDAVDILAIAMEAGLAFDSALAKVARHVGGPLGEEFGRTLWELQLGVSRKDAIRNLGDRNDVPELQRFCTTMIQADSFGVSIAKVLKNEAAELRTRRRQAAEEQALKTPVKLVFPVVLVILPALMIVVIGPGAIRIAAALISS